MEREAMEIQEGKDTQWETANLHDFWGKIAFQNSLIQLYEDEKSFLLTLEGFVGSSILTGFSVIVIATREHLDQLLFRLQQQSLSIPDLIESGHYIPLDVADVIKTIMPDGVLDTAVFYEVITKSLKSVEQENRHCCLFTELSAMLLQTVGVHHVEDLNRCWESIHQDHQFTLFSALPGWILRQAKSQSDYSPYQGTSIAIKGDPGPPTEITFRMLST